MSESDSTPPDDISLVDLLAVLIRYRRLVLGLPVLTAVGAIVLLYAIPLFAPEPVVGTPGYVAEREVVFEAVLPQTERFLSQTPQDAFRSLVSDVRVVLRAYQSVSTSDRVSTLSEAGLFLYIRDEVIGERVTVETGEARDTLIVRAQSDTADHAEALLSAVLAEASARFADTFEGHIRAGLHSAATELRVAELQLETLDRAALTAEQLPGRLQRETLFSALAGNFETAVQTYSRAVLAWDELNRLADNIHTLFEVDSEVLLVAQPPVLPPQTTRRSVVVLVAVFASAFFAIFLAFLLNYVRLVRADAEESAKLRTAWERT